MTNTIDRRSLLAGSLVLGAGALALPRMAFAQGTGSRNLLFVLLRGAADEGGIRDSTSGGDGDTPPTTRPTTRIRPPRPAAWQERSTRGRRLSSMQSLLLLQL